MPQPKQDQDPVSLLGVLQLRRIVRALGLPTTGLRPELARRVREARASGVLLRFVQAEQQAVPVAPSESCGE